MVKAIFALARCTIRPRRAANNASRNKPGLSGKLKNALLDFAELQTIDIMNQHEIIFYSNSANFIIFR